MAKRHGKDARLYVEGYDLSGDSVSFDVNVSIDTAEQTGLNDRRKNYMLGLMDASISQNGIFNDAPERIHDVLSQEIGSADLAVLAAHGTHVGAYGWGGSAVALASYSVSAPIGDRVAITANYQSAGSSGLDPVRLAASAEEGLVTGAGEVVDDGAETTQGARAYLQVLDVVGTVTPSLQHGTSPTGTFTDLVTFSSFTGRGVEAKAVSGTVRRYIRRNISAGTAQIVMAWYRIP